MEELKMDKDDLLEAFVETVLDETLTYAARLYEGQGTPFHESKLIRRIENKFANFQIGPLNKFLEEVAKEVEHENSNP